MSYCIFNNQLTVLEQLTIPIQSSAVQYGVGLFETLRTYQHKSLPFLDQHLERLFNAISGLNIDCSYRRNDVSQMVYQLVDTIDNELQRVKILVIPDGLLVTSSPLVEEPDKRYKLTRQQLTRSMPEYKSTSYLACHQAWQLAQAQGFDDCILVDEHGFIYETGRANLFWVDNKTLYTRETDVLPGIMRQFVLTSSPYKTCFENITIDALCDMDEVFMTNSIRGIMPVSTIDTQTLNNFTLASELQTTLADFVSNFQSDALRNQD